MNSAYPRSGPVSKDALLRILVIDDECGEFLLLEASFDACGVEVELETATSGRHAIAGLRSVSDGRRPDLALVDIGLPRTSGFVLARWFIERGIPTVMMSTLVTPERSARARAIGAADLLVKPRDSSGYARMAARVLEIAGRPMGNR